MTAADEHESSTLHSLRRIFREASRLMGNARRDYLDVACADDPSLRSEVEELLAANENPHPVLTAKPPPQGGPLPERLGDFRVLDLLGRGGMGVVYRAEQETPRRSVALKVLQPGFVHGEALHRFVRESEVLGSLQHPGIASLFEAGQIETEYGPVPYLSMEVVDGAPIDRYATEHELDVAARCQLMIQVCKAAHHAHQHGVVHRDLKPANLLVTERDGEPWVKILDFGIARATQEGQGERALTVTGQIVGTLPYMSPEQISGRDPLDARTDVYALGVLLYQLLSGELPLALQDLPLSEVARLVRDSDPPALRSKRPELSVDLETITSRALEKTADRRYPSARALAADLENYLADRPILARPTSHFSRARKFVRRHRALVVGGLATIVVSLAGAAVAILLAVRASQHAATAERTAYRATLAAAESITHELGTLRRYLDSTPPELRGWEWRHLSARHQPQLLEFGKPLEGQIALLEGERLVALLEDELTLSVYELSTGRRQQTIRLPFPSRRFAVSDRGGRVATASAAGGVFVRSLEEDAPWVEWLPEGSCIADSIGFDPAGERVAIRSADELRIGAGDHWVSVILQRESNSRDTSYFYSFGLRPEFSADGLHIQLLAGPHARHFWTVEVNTGSVIRDQPLPEPTQDVVFSPAVNQYVLAQQSFLALADPDSLVVEKVLSGHHSRTAGVTLAADGRLAAAWDGDGARVWDLPTGQCRLAVGEPGCRFAQVLESGRLVLASPERISLWEVDGMATRVLGPHGSYVYEVAWSKESWLVALSFTGELTVWDTLTSSLLWRAQAPPQRYPFEVHLTADPDGESFTVSGPEGEHCRYDWLQREPSPSTAPPDRPRRLGVAAGRTRDGITLVECGNSFGGGPLRILDPATRELRFTLGTRYHGLALHPQDELVAAVFGSQDVEIWSLRSRELVARLPNPAGDFSAAFSPDGQRLATGGRLGVVRIWDTTHWGLLAELRGHNWYAKAVAFSPDGTQLASASGDRTVALWDTLPARERYREILAAKRHQELVHPRVEAWAKEASEVPEVLARIREAWPARTAERRAALRVLARLVER
jgi:WD40 repeat protein